MSSVSSRSGSCRQTSRMCAPRRTCSAADLRRLLDTCPSAISCLNLRLPSTLVRSPTITGRVSSSIDQGLDARRRRCGAPATAGAAGCRAAISASMRMCSARRAAAAADDVEPAVGAEALELLRQHRRQLVVVALLVGQAGVREARDREARDLRERAQVVGHEVRAGGAVEADGEADRGARPRRTSASIGWPASIVPQVSIDTESTTGTRAAELREGVVDAEQRGLDVERVLLGLEEQHVGAALDQADGLLGVGAAHLVEGDVLGDRDRLGARAHRAGDEARPVGASRPRRPPRAPGARRRG